MSNLLIEFAAGGVIGGTIGFLVAGRPLWVLALALLPVLGAALVIGIVP